MYKITVNNNFGVLYSDSNIICIKENDELCIYDSIHLYTLKRLNIKSNTNTVGSYKDGIFFFEDNNTLFVSIKHNETFIKNNVFYYYILEDNYEAFVDLAKVDNIIFLTDEKKIITIKREAGYKLFLKNLLIQIVSKKDNIIKANSISLQGKLIWQTHFKNLCGVDTVYPQNEVLESNEKLYIVISSQGGRKGLFVIDLKTGKEIGFYKDLVFRPFKDNDSIYISTYQNKFCRIDSKTDKIVEYELNEIVKKNGFESLHDHRFCVSNNILYFTQTLGSKVAKLGVIDLNNQTMVYKYDFPKESGAIGSIQVSNERIYVHTQDNTLHIFQKENPSI